MKKKFVYLILSVLLSIGWYTHLDALYTLQMLTYCLKEVRKRHVVVFQRHPQFCVSSPLLQPRHSQLSVSFCYFCIRTKKYDEMRKVHPMIKRLFYLSYYFAFSYICIYSSYSHISRSSNYYKRKANCFYILYQNNTTFNLWCVLITYFRHER